MRQATQASFEHLAQTYERPNLVQLPQQRPFRGQVTQQTLELAGLKEIQQKGLDVRLRGLHSRAIQCAAPLFRPAQGARRSCTKIGRMLASTDRLLSQTIKHKRALVTFRYSIESFSEYKARLPFIEGGSSRTTLARTDEFEVIGTQWAPSSTTPIHDHGNSRCWVVVTHGQLRVEGFKRLDHGDQTRINIDCVSGAALSEGTVSMLAGPRQMHRVTNESPESAYTVQLYMPPIATYTVLDVEAWTAFLGVPEEHAELSLLK